jgi:hypothetical protein
MEEDGVEKKADFRATFAGFDDTAFITIAEIADLMAISVGAVSQRLHGGKGVCSPVERGNRLLRWRAGAYREWSRSLEPIQIERNIKEAEKSESPGRLHQEVSKGQSDDTTDVLSRNRTGRPRLPVNGGLA